MPVKTYCYKDSRDNNSGVYTQEGDSLTIGEVTDLINYLIEENERLVKKLDADNET